MKYIDIFCTNCNHEFVVGSLADNIEGPNCKAKISLDTKAFKNDVSPDKLTY
jgi:hypothetical protein